MHCKWAIAYLYHATYIMSAICTYAYSCILTHASFGQSYQLTYNFQINHIIHVNILYTNILTSTSHHQSSNDLHYTLGLIVTPCSQIAYNQAMQWPCSYTNTSQAKQLEHIILLPHNFDQVYHSIQAMIYYNCIPIMAKIWT